MKRFVVPLITLTVLLPIWGRGEPYWAPDKKDTLGLLSAKQTNRIRVAIRGAYNPHRLYANPVSSHFGECMEVRIENVTDSMLHVVLPCGTMLLSLDSSTQNMLVSETRYFALAPRQKKYARINALCSELHKNAPDVYVNYEVGQLVSEPLLRLAHVIEANSAQNKAGQYAVWAVTDKATKNELGEDYELLHASQKLLTLAGISFNIMGKQAEAGATTVPAKNMLRTEGAVNMLTIEGKDVSLVANNEQLDMQQAINDTVALCCDAKEITVGGNKCEDRNYQVMGSDTASELVVYAIGALLLGLGIYILAKKATHRSA